MSGFARKRPDKVGDRPDRIGPFGLSKVGGHRPYDRFCLWPPAPSRLMNRDSRGFQIGPHRFSAHTGRFLDLP
jgi:hypothetical protein